MFPNTSVVSQMVLYALEACLVNLELPLKNYESVLTLVKVVSKAVLGRFFHSSETDSYPCAV